MNELTSWAHLFIGTGFVQKELQRAEQMDCVLLPLVSRVSCRL